MKEKINNYLNEENTKLNKFDYITITIITIIYTIISFYNLGSNICPNTFIRTDANSSMYIELKNEEDVMVMKIFSGERNSFYNIAVSDDNKYYEVIDSITGRGAFSWDKIRPRKKTKYIRLDFTDNSSIGEIVLYNNAGKRINIKKITYDNKKVKVLTDEVNTIPKEVSYMNSSYFDEVYFARTAYEYVNNIPTYEWTHPPLGKLIQSIPIFITKHLSPFNYRLMGNISGILMIIIMYLFGKELFKKRKYSIFASLLLLFDTFHFVQTRMGTVDSHLVLVMLISSLFMLKYIKSDSTKHLLISGLFFGLSICIKWTGFYLGLGLAIIYFTHMIKNKLFNVEHIVKGSSFFVVIPVIIYLSLYFIFPNNLYYTNNLNNFVKQQQEMYTYHSKLKDDHFFSSKWYTWPISYKPVWLHEVDYNDDTKETITGIGNIVIWWIGILGMLYLIPKSIIKKDKETFFILIMVLSLWLPYVFIGRVMFLYHYFPVTPFMMLSIVLLFKDIENKFKVKYLIPVYLLFVIAFFIMYYPVTSGIRISTNYIDALKLLKSWYF